MPLDAGNTTVFPGSLHLSPGVDWRRHVQQFAIEGIFRRYPETALRQEHASPHMSERRSVLAVTVLVVCPELAGLASLTDALSGSFTTLTARTAEKAVLLAREHPDCRLALLALESDLRALPRLAAALQKTCPGLVVVGLIRQPCTPALREAVANGTLQAIHALPLTPEELRAKAWALLTRFPETPPHHQDNLDNREGKVLTNEEIAFLLGVPSRCRPADS